MKFVILTGMSGAGKSTAIKMMEDIGYYCVDNLPIALLEKFVELSSLQETAELQKVAVGIDIRNGQALEEMRDVLARIKKKQVHYEILFLDAEDSVLVKRYKETRRNHPLSGGDRVDKGIEEERKRLAFLKESADYIIDTSQLLTRELKAELDKIFVQNQDYKNLFITILSFGFKYGIPADSDLVFDVRFLPNPFYIKEIRAYTGLEAPVRDYVLGKEETREFLSHLYELVDYLLPLYQREGKRRLMIAIGCTGGAHRSVAISEALGAHLRALGQPVSVSHRDITLEEASWPFRREK